MLFLDENPLHKILYLYIKKPVLSVVSISVVTFCRDNINEVSCHLHWWKRYLLNCLSKISNPCVTHQPKAIHFLDCCCRVLSTVHRSSIWIKSYDCQCINQYLQFAPFNELSIASITPFEFVFLKSGKSK